MKKKMGRPRLAQTDVLTDTFSVRLREDEASAVRDAIHQSGQKKSDWLRSALLRAAQKKLAK
jgi:hypothetical protein